MTVSERAFMDQKFQTESECLEEVRAFLLRQYDRHEEFVRAENGSPKPYWY